MRYLSDAAGFQEALEIGVATGAMPPTHLRPRLTPNSRLALEPATFIPCGDMTLVLAERTASWVLLSAAEVTVVRALADTRFADFEASACRELGASGLELLVGLYQRGLLRVDGRPGVDPKLLQDGALFHDGYLVEILVTQKCNLACRYCLAEAGPDMRHLHPDSAYSAIDAAFNLPRSRPLVIQLSGGEPFLNFTLFKDLIDYIEKKRGEMSRDVTVATQSNGTLIDDEIAAFVREHGISIGVSCDGPRPLSDRSRPTLGGRSSLDLTARGMSALRRHGVPFGVISVLSRANVTHPRELIGFYQEQEISSVKINPVNSVGDAQANWEDSGISAAEYFDFMEEFIDHLVDSEAPLAEANLREYLQHLVRRVHNYRCMRSNCGAGRSFFLIDSQGDVYPCAHSAGLPEWHLGAIGEAEGNLPSLGSRNPVLLDFPVRLVDRMSETQRCPWRHFCEGGCAVNAYQHSNTILSADTLCAFYERLYPRLFQRLARDPARFQLLLDLTLGAGAATVIER